MALAVGALAPYIVNVCRRKTRPKLSSWTLFCVLNTLQGVVALANGEEWTAAFSGALALGPAAVVVVGLYTKAYSEWQNLDTYCLLAALAGVGVWLTLDAPEWAVVVFIAVSFVAMVPTLQHALAKPHEETWLTFGVNLVASSLALAALTDYTFIAVAIPAYVVIMSVVLVVIIVVGQRGQQRTHKT